MLPANTAELGGSVRKFSKRKFVFKGGVAVAEHSPTLEAEMKSG